MRCPGVLPGAAHPTEKVYAVRCEGVPAPSPPVAPAVPESSADATVSGRCYSPLSATLQSHAFQKMVGARIEGSMPSTRSLIAVTLGNWKMVTP